MRELKWIGRYAVRYLPQYIIGILALYTVDQLNVHIPQLTGEITDGLKAGTMDMTMIRHMILQILLLGIIIAIGRFMWRYFINIPSHRSERDMRNDLFRHLEMLSPQYFTEHKTGDLMAHFTNDIEAVRMMIGFTVITAFDASVMMVLVLVKMIRYVNVRLTVIAVIPLLIIILGDYMYGKVMHQRFLAKQAAFSDLTDLVQEDISGIRVIKSFIQERQELAAFTRKNLFNKEKNMAVVRLRSLFMPALDLIVGVSGLLTLLYGGWLAIRGEISLGQFIAFNQYIGMIVWPMIAVSECVTNIAQGLASARRICTILDEKPTITDMLADPKVKHLQGGIDLKDLSFAYPGHDTVQVLSNLDLHIAPGETLAVIGRTGSGKTTLSGLLLRLYDVPEGTIFIDGHDIRHIPLRTLREEIAYVPQDNFLFSDTIRANIAFGVQEAFAPEHPSDRGAPSGEMEEAIVRAAKDACVHDNIMEFPKEYDTIVGERGVTLSGGQKQRISIARALLKEAPVMILDDALSAVDTDTEEQILKNLKARRKGKTTIIIAHRVSTIQDADHILVIDEGRIAEYGDHESLMARGGLYCETWTRQQLERMLMEEGDV